MLLLAVVLGAAADPGSLSEREINVLSTVVNHGIAAGTTMIVIAEDTTGDPAGIGDSETRQALADSLEVPISALQDWTRKNRNAHRIDRPLDIAVPYQLMSNADLDEIFATDQPQISWDQFRARYGEAPGILRLSRVGFADDFSVALVYVELQCGATCGAGRLLEVHTDAEQGWQVRGGTVVWLTE